MMAILMPFWTSVMVRIASWMVVLPRKGLVNQALIAAHAISTPLNMLYDRAGVYVAMVNVLLPFMVLPLYSVMRDISRAYQMAAESLGSHPFGAFWRVYFPLTIAGVKAGSTLVFTLALGYFIIPALIGGAHDEMISNYIAYYTNTQLNWGFASALSVSLIASAACIFVVSDQVGRLWSWFRNKLYA